MASAAFKFIPIQSAWFSPKLEELHLQLELERDSIRVDGPNAAQWEALDAALEAAEALDIALSNAGWASHMRGSLDGGQA